MPVELMNEQEWKVARRKFFVSAYEPPYHPDILENNMYTAAELGRELLLLGNEELTPPAGYQEFTVYEEDGLWWIPEVGGMKEEHRARSQARWLTYASLLKALLKEREGDV